MDTMHEVYSPAGKVLMLNHEGKAKLSLHQQLEDYIDHLTYKIVGFEQALKFDRSGLYWMVRVQCIQQGWTHGFEYGTLSELIEAGYVRAHEPLPVGDRPF